MKVTKNIYLYPEAGILDCNTYLIDDELLCIVDPGNSAYAQRLFGKMKEDGFAAKDIDLIINTHSHPDHTTANGEVKEISGAKIVMHEEEASYMKSVVPRIIDFFASSLSGAKKFAPDIYFSQDLSTGKMDWRVMRTPGHSPGSACLYCEEKRVLISGDVIFQWSIGRTDFPGGSLSVLKRSIQSLSELQIELLLPGHGQIIKGKGEVRRNFQFLDDFLIP